MSGVYKPISNFPRRIAFETFERMIAKGPWLLIGGLACHNPVGGYEPIRSARLALGDIYLYGDAKDYSFCFGHIRGITQWHIEIYDGNTQETLLFVLINPTKLYQAVQV